MTVLELNVTAKFRNVQSWRRNKMKQSFFLIIHTYNIKYLLLIVLSLKINTHILRYLTKTANKLVYTLPLPTRQPCFFFWIISGGIFSSGILTHFHLVKWGHRRRRSLCTVVNKSTINICILRIDSLIISSFDFVHVCYSNIMWSTRIQCMYCCILSIRALSWNWNV